METQVAQRRAPLSHRIDGGASVGGPSSYPSQRRCLARACIDYVLQSGPSGQVGRAWLGERLFSEHARLEIPEAHSLRTGNETLRLDSMSSEEVSERLRLSRESLERFGHWSSNQFRGSFKVIYVAEGGDPSQRREAVFDFVQSSVNDDAAEPLLLCGDIDTTILRRLRPFRPIVLNDISDDSGFSLEELVSLRSPV